MESETNNQERDKIDEVEGFGSEGDLLDEKSDNSYKRQSSHKSCDDISGISESNRISLAVSLPEDSENIRTRTESTSSVPCIRPATMGYIGLQKGHRKRDMLRRKMDKLRRKTTGVRNDLF